MMTKRTPKEFLEWLQGCEGFIGEWYIGLIREYLVDLSIEESKQTEEPEHYWDINILADRIKALEDNQSTINRIIY